MGDAIWLFIWCIDKTTKETTTESGERLGTILGGAPVRDGDIAQSIPGCSRKLVRKWRQHLVAGGYLVQKRTPYGHTLSVYKSKKWPPKEEARELPERATLTEERSAETGAGKCPDGYREVPERVITKKTLQDSTKDSSSSERKMYDQENHYVPLSGKGWERLGLHRISDRYADFVNLVKAIKPRPTETKAAFCGRILDECGRQGVDYPPEFLAITRRLRKESPNVPFFNVAEQIAEERRRRDGLA